jgi:hypothetical protein
MRGPNEYILFRDGNAWCAAPPRFHNLQRDPIGWGDTRERAVRALINNPEFQLKALQEDWPERPDIAEFREMTRIKYERDPHDPADWKNEAERHVALKLDSLPTLPRRAY